MTQLTQLKQQIRSIKTTKKITHAVRLVSMSFYSKLEKQNVALQEYKKSLSATFSQILPEIPDWKNPILFPEDILDINPLIVIISSSKGLCGSFNSNLFRYFDRAFFIEEHQKPTFITIGQKATKAIKEKYSDKNIISYDELTASNFVTIANELTDKITSGEKIFSSVNFYSNYLKNFFIQRPHKTSLIPVNLELVKNKECEQKGSFFDNLDFTWEQDKNTILDYTANRYLKSSVLDIVFQSFISEQASRFLAMDSSTTNAENFLEKLTLQFNKARQALITREVSELSASM